MESDLYLHLGLCAQSSENCLQGTTAGVNTLFRDMSTWAELGTEIHGSCVARGNNVVIHFWRSRKQHLILRLRSTGLSIASRGQRGAQFKSSDLHTRSYFLQRRDSYRYSVGLAPHIARNTRAKCCWVLKPQAMATSSTRISAERNISFARWTRYHRRHWCGVWPVVLRKTCEK